MQGLDPHRVRGVLLFVRWPPVGGCGSPPRGLRYLREEGRESGGAVGARRARWDAGGVGCGLLVGCAREGDRGAVSSAAERHRAAVRAEGRPGLAKARQGAHNNRQPPPPSTPPKPPRPQHQPAPPAPRAEPARMASAEGGRGAALAPQAQGQRGEPARGAEAARPWDRDWGTVPDPLGEEALPLVGEVYGWLCWANQGTTRGLRNRPFDAMLLRRDGGNREVPPGGRAAPEDHERVLRSVIRAAWPDREPTWPAFLEGGAVLRIMDADANNWLPRALRSALAHWRYRRRNPPPPQPEPPHKRRRRSRPRRRTRKSGGGSWAPRPTPPPRYSVTQERAPPPAGGRAETTSPGGNLLPRSPLTADR